MNFCQELIACLDDCDYDACDGRQFCYGTIKDGACMFLGYKHH